MAELLSESETTVKQSHDWLLFKEITDKLRVQMASRLLGPGEGRTLLDLGAGTCVFSRRARDAGWKVTAVDARTEVLPDDMEGITFVQSDVREFDPSGFDTIFNLGLLYHLPIQDQKRLLTACAYTRVILETQVHTPGIVGPLAEPWAIRCAPARADRPDADPEPLGDEHEDTSWLVRLRQRHPAGTDPSLRGVYAGVIYPEPHGAVKPIWQASIGNKTSFWQTEPSLLGMLEECGYTSTRIIEPPLYSVYRHSPDLRAQRGPAADAVMGGCSIEQRDVGGQEGPG